MQQFTGWLLDIYPLPDGMAVWLIADDGRRLRAVDKWLPRFFITGTPEEADRVKKFLGRDGVPVSSAKTLRREFMTGEEIPVWEFRVGNAANFPRLTTQARLAFPNIDFFDADIPVDRMWFYENRRHPLARVEAEMSADGTLIRMDVRDSIWDLDYGIPPFITLGLRADGPAFLHPARGGRKGGLEVHTADGTRVLDTGEPKELLSRLASVIREEDPDIIVTEHGDGWLLPILAGMSHETGISLPLNRDTTMRPRVSPARSYFTYGRMMRTDESWFLRGRLHLDKRNSFTLEAAGFEGLWENARLSRIPVQTASRTSTGTGISSMQVARAVEEGILVPVEKRVPEEFKGADELLEVDKGGLVFQPDVGVHEGVAELDFVSMYPTIMVEHNLSPETVGCSCCRETGELIPELGLRSCRRRKGLIPRVLAPLLAKRAGYKELKKNSPVEAVRARAKARVEAHKWMLVCCFGYLGYRNARFGRIEAHEATTAWGRETLLLAKETAERMGFRVLHAIVDCLWVVRVDGMRATREDYAVLAEAIGRDTGMPISLEGVYHWLAFLPSRADPEQSVAQRYMGAFEAGEVKARGIEARRSDTPGFIKAMQTGLLDELARTHSIAEARVAATGLVERVNESLAELESGRVRAEDLVVTTRLSKPADEYTRPSPSAVAAQQLLCRGVKLEPGDKVGYVYGDSRPLAVEVMEDGAGYDTQRYGRLLLRAANTVLSPFGVDAFREGVGVPSKPLSACNRGRRTKRVEGPEVLYLFPE
jgi:DNA polymerase-2